ncbi:hypothetical protein Ahy_A07g032694 [Arachis hypogaea]|uniref:Protein FAR1-RELATED SEQUENCE n=1 Tax=Arachis hypogaea TaxID=3818 RepID=A0A445C7H6_ARAHY|nr:hypothetical protein Ahy_A07g032694 [Arachis hypogaea]
MLADMETDEFETHWESMVNDCGVGDVDWVKDLYSKKYAWASADIRGRFLAGVRTTSRCELLHAKLGRFVESRYGVLEFVRKFQMCVNFLRDKEDELEFCSLYGTPVLQTDFVELKKSAWMKFTREMFARFRESLKREPTSNIFSCMCMRMESFGIPCVHIVAMCVWLDLGEIPESIVLRRWSKTTKIDIENENIDHHTADQSVTYKTRLGGFSQLCKRLGRVACMSDKDFKLYSKKLLSDAIFLEIKSVQSSWGSAAKTKRKCSTCGKLEHWRTRCPNEDTQPASTNEKATVGTHKRKRSKVIF